jgi:hypothetical protein
VSLFRPCFQDNANVVVALHLSSIIRLLEGLLKVFETIHNNMQETSFPPFNSFTPLLGTFLHICLQTSNLLLLLLLGMGTSELQAGLHKRFITL